MCRYLPSKNPQAPNFNVAGNSINMASFAFRVWFFGPPTPSTQPEGNIEIWGCVGDNNTAGVWFHRPSTVGKWCLWSETCWSTWEVIPITKVGMTMIPWVLDWDTRSISRVMASSPFLVLMLSYDIIGDIFKYIQVGFPATSMVFVSAQSKSWFGCDFFSPRNSNPLTSAQWTKCK